MNSTLSLIVVARSIGLELIKKKWTSFVHWNSNKSKKKQVLYSNENQSKSIRVSVSFDNKFVLMPFRCWFIPTRSSFSLLSQTKNFNQFNFHRWMIVNEDLSQWTNWKWSDLKSAQKLMFICKMSLISLNSIRRIEWHVRLVASIGFCF